jgi:polyisoprenoid-binding protein YceI
MSVIVLMRAFQFEKKLMQEHFNENYVESDTYPKATFTGILMNNSDIDYLTNGEYQAEVKGELTIHGVTQEIRTRGSVEVKKEGILTKAEFLLNPEDYGIKIPGVVRKNIAKNLEIRIHLFHTPI